MTFMLTSNPDRRDLSPISAALSHLLPISYIYTLYYINDWKRWCRL